MAIHLIRHGETVFNAARVVQMPNTPLSERGLAQARRLGARFAPPVRITAILASDYARARMTAEAVRATSRAPIRFSPLLRERHFGALRGRAFSTFDMDPFAHDYEPPGGESWPVFHERVERAWEEMRAFADEHDGDVAVVSHALVCRRVAEHHAPLGPGVDPLDASWGNTCVTVIDGPPWQVTLLACTAHIDGSDVEPGRRPPGI